MEPTLKRLAMVMSTRCDDIQPMFVANTAFGPWDGDKWEAYKRWSGLSRLDELVSLDRILCPLVPTRKHNIDWQDQEADDDARDYIADVDCLIADTADVEHRNILCVFRNPTEKLAAPLAQHQFQLFGYDLVDRRGHVSALSNCGGFPDAFDKDELTHNGLIGSCRRALQIQIHLRKNYPEEPHADCDVWAIFRAELTH